MTVACGEGANCAVAKVVVVVENGSGWKESGCVEFNAPWSDAAGENDRPRTTRKIGQILGC